MSRVVDMVPRTFIPLEIYVEAAARCRFERERGTFLSEPVGWKLEFL